MPRLIKVETVEYSNNESTEIIKCIKEILKHTSNNSVLCDSIMKLPTNPKQYASFNKYIKTLAGLIDMKAEEMNIDVFNQ